MNGEDRIQEIQMVDSSLLIFLAQPNVHGRGVLGLQLVSVDMVKTKNSSICKIPFSSSTWATLYGDEWP